jgi:hypothetical protein
MMLIKTIRRDRNLLEPQWEKLYDLQDSAYHGAVLCHLFNQHAIPIREKPVAFLNRMLVSTQNLLASGKG